MIKKAITVIVSLALFASLDARAQIVNEEFFPQLLLPQHSEAIQSGQTGFFVVGLQQQSWYNNFLDESWGIGIPYYFWKDSTGSYSIVSIPDTARLQGQGFEYNHDELNTAFAVTPNNVPVVLWSKMRIYTSDVPPLYFDSPILRGAIQQAGSLQEMFPAMNGVNPRAVVDRNNTVHFVYEKPTPLDSVGYYHRFTKYRSEILYQTRTANGDVSAPVSFGNGFFPDLSVTPGGVVHVVWYGGDSTNAPLLHLRYSVGSNSTFSSPVDLTDIANPQFRSFTLNNPLSSVQWSVDDLGSLHYGFKRLYTDQAFMLHYNTTTGIELDSSQAYYALIIKYHFLPDGEVRAVWFSQDSYASGTFCNYSSNANGRLFAQIQKHQVPDNSIFDELLIDTSGAQHALLNDDKKNLYLIKDLPNGKDTVFLLANGYTVAHGFYVAPDNRAWLIGYRDSSTYFLNFSIKDVGVKPNFTFPLAIGDAWNYQLENIEAPLIDPFIGNERVTADRDTTMPNGLRYVCLTSRRLGTKFYRKDGFRIYQYSLSDSCEYLKYNFGASVNDTISLNSHRAIQLASSSNKVVFGSQRVCDIFRGTIPHEADYQSEIADSLGVIGTTDGLSYGASLIGAIINGVKYGTIDDVSSPGIAKALTFFLSANYPNPFNPSTTIRFSIPERSRVRVTIFNLLGQQVDELANREMVAGIFEKVWNANVASGLYFYRLEAVSVVDPGKKFVDVKKMILLK